MAVLPELGFAFGWTTSTEQGSEMTRKKKIGNFEKLVTDILDNIDPLVPKGMTAVEVIGALEAAKLILLKKLITATDLTSLVKGVMNERSWKPSNAVRENANAWGGSRTGWGRRC
jgi:hypothetical protein